MFAPIQLPAYRMAMLERLIFNLIQVKWTQSITLLWIVRFVKVRNTALDKDLDDTKATKPSTRKSRQRALIGHAFSFFYMKNKNTY